MKKIRILALVLALLMLPLGMLVSCKKDPVEEPSEEEEEGNTKLPSQNTSTNTDNDGTKEGYLMFFNFDAAKSGAFPSDRLPYSKYIAPNASKPANYVIGRRDVGGKIGGYMGIEKKAQSGDPIIDVKVGSITELSQKHVLEFDIMLGGGLMNHVASVQSRKAPSGTTATFETFISFRPNGDVVVGGKTIYTAKASGEWVNIALAINDIDLTYDVYINGVKKIVKHQYNNKDFPNWNLQKAQIYRFTTNGSSASEVRIDNLGVSNGTEPVNVKGSEVIWTYNFTQEYEFFTPTKDSVLAFYTSNPEFAGKVKDSEYATDKLLMSSALCLSRLQELYEGFVTTDLQFDYGVEKGNYNYGGALGGRTFYLEDSGKFFEFTRKIYMFNDGSPDSGYGFPIVINESGDEGYYIVSGEENCVKVKIVIGNQKTYAVYSDGVFKTAADETYTVDEYSIEYKKADFHNKTYLFKKDDKIISLSPDQINGRVNFTVNIDGTTYSEYTEFTYDESRGLFKVTLDKEYLFTYNRDEDLFKLHIDENETYSLPMYKEPEEEIKDDELLLHWQNFSKGLNALKFPIDKDSEAYKFSDKWENLKLNIYSINSVALKIYIQTGDSDYFVKEYSISNKGMQEIILPISSFTVNGNADLSNIQYVKIEAVSGEGFYLKSVRFFNELTAIVEGPDLDGIEDDAEKEEKLNCKHKKLENDVEISLLAPAGTVAPTCTAFGYTALKCTECGATVVDASQKITPAHGHDTTGQELLKVYPTCENSGYTYRLCRRPCGDNKTCNAEVIEETFPVTPHDLYDVYDFQNNLKISTCRNCGYEESSEVVKEVLSGSEKYNLLTEKLPGMFSWFMVSEGKNDNIVCGSLSSVSDDRSTFDSLSILHKQSMFISGRSYGNSIEYYAEFQRIKNRDAFADLVVGSGKVASGSQFVYEFDMKLGKDQNGKYGTVKFRLRQDGSNFIDFLQTTSDGVLKINNSDVTYKLSPDKFTTVSVVMEPLTNSKSVYINGILLVSGVKLEANEDKDISGFTVNNVRIEWFGDSGSNEDTPHSHYFNNLFVYPGSPIGLVYSDFVEEAEGELKLNDGEKNVTALENVLTDTFLSLQGNPIWKTSKYTFGFKLSVSEELLTLKHGDNDVTALENVSVDTFLSLQGNPIRKTSKYTFGFKLSVSEELLTAEGALLKGKKHPVSGDDKEYTLLSVQGGYLWYGDKSICELKAGETIDVQLFCEDDLSRITIYVNGKQIGNTMTYSADEYGTVEECITGFTFCKLDAATYSVSEIKLILKAEGTLLKGTKLVYGVEKEYQLLWVSRGYLWYGDMPICKLEADKDIDIQFFCEDYLSRISVYVNGQQIDDTMPYSADEYGSVEDYITGFTFCKIDTATYSVSDIKMVSGDKTAQ